MFVVWYCKCNSAPTQCCRPRRNCRKSELNFILSFKHKIYNPWAVKYSFSLIQVYSEVKFGLVYAFTRNFSFIQAFK